MAVEGVGLLVDYLTTGAIRHAVNMMPLDPKTLAELRGYLDVGYRLGLLLAQLDTAGIKRCTLQYRGEVAGKNTKLLTASLRRRACWHTRMEQEINIVNAEVLLRERGIELVEERAQRHGRLQLGVVQAEVETERKTHKAAGTVFGTNMLRLVQLDDYRLEAYLDGVLMVFTHQRRAGHHRHVGTIFGKHKVNIAPDGRGPRNQGGRGDRRAEPRPDPARRRARRSAQATRPSTAPP